jgi:hypothetical protein
VGDPVRLVDKDSQHAGFAAPTQLNLYHLEPLRGRHAFDNRPHLIEVNRHKNKDLHNFCVLKSVCK